MTDPQQEILTDRVPTIACNQCGQTVDVSAFAPFSEINCPHCATQQTVPAQLAHFLLVKELGAGGMGRVYHGFDPNLNRFVAIKVMQASLGADAQFVETFRREAQAAALLNHPNIVQIYSFGTEKGQPYIVMEFLPGKRLNELIAEQGQLEQEFVAKVGVDVANGLNAASSAGLLHGDVKPENVVLDEKGTAKLVDFGLSSSIDKQQESGIWGSPYYISPEKVARQRVDSRSDMYGLGATLFHAITGSPPFDGEDPIEVVKARLTETPTPVAEAREDVDPALAAAIDRMLELDPARRHPTYASLVADIEKSVQSIKANQSGRHARPKGKVQIKKRGGSSGGSSSSGGGRGKVIVTKSRRSVATSRTRAADADADAGAEEAAPAATQTPQKRRKKKKKKPVGLWIFLGILLVFCLGGGYYAWHTHKQDTFYRFKLKRNAERSAETARDKFTTATDAGGQVASIHSRATNAMQEVDMAAARIFAAEDYQRLATEAGQKLSFLETMTGSGPAEPAEDAPAEEETKAEDEEPAEEASAAEPATAAPAAAPKPKASRRDAFGREMPAGLNPLRIGGAAPVLEEEAVAAPAPAGNPDDRIPGVPPIRPERIPPLRELVNQNSAQGLFTNCVEAFAATLGHVGNMMIATNMMASEVEGMDGQLAQLVRADNTPSAETLLVAFNKFLPRIDEARSDFDFNMTNAVSSVELLLQKRASFIRMKDKAVASQKDMRAQRAASVKRRADFIKAYKEKQLYQKRVKEEQLRVVTLHEDKRRLYLKGNHFRDAHGEFMRARRTFKTDEGLADLQVHIDRYQALVELQQFIIKSITDSNCEWCWQQRIDVVGANQIGIKIRTREEIIPWNEVDVAHMMRFIKTYLLNDNRNDLERKARARMNLAAGIFCLEHGSAEAAQSFRDRALSIWDRGEFKETVDRLLPDQGGGNVFGF